MESFLEFYSRVRQSQINDLLFPLNEAEFTKGVDYSAQADYATRPPSHPNVATDNLQGRTTKQIQTPKKSLEMDKLLRQKSWEEYKKKNPEAAAAYEKMNQDMRAQRRASKESEVNIFNKVPYAPDYHGKLQGEAKRNPVARLALKIDDVFHRLKGKYSGQMFSTELMKTLMGDLKEMGVPGDHDAVKQALQYLSHVSGEGLFKKTDQGWIIEPKANRGDVEDVWSSNRGDTNLMGRIFQMVKDMRQLATVAADRSGDKNAARFDPHVLEKAKELKAATELFMKSGRIGGAEREKIESIHRTVSNMLQQATTPGV
jgi:hypothetical protein